MNNLLKSLWVEKYRPSTIDDVIMKDERQKRYFKSIVESGDLPNLLLQGVRGTGKSSISKALINDLKVDPSDVLTIKCSSQKIDALRDKVEGFAMTFPVGKFKVVRLEEFDYMSLDGQALLRSLIEDVSGNCRFIATCNYINKVMPELRSRFQEIVFKNPDRDELTLRMADILEKEGVSYDPENLISYVSVGYPDIRKTIQLLHGNLDKKVLLPAAGATAQEAEWKFGLLDLVSKGDFHAARKLVCESSSREEHADVFRFMYENLDKMKLKDKDQAIVTIAEYLYRHSIVADTELNIAALFVELGRC
jgi:replication factor C small subunit